MKTRCNIFICHTPFHVYISRQVCLTNFHQPEYENWLIATVLMRSEYATENFKYIYIPKKMPGRLIMMWSAKIRILARAYKFGPAAEFFLPHLHGVFGNYIFNSQTIARKGGKVNFYYEGAVMIDPLRTERTIHNFVGQKKALSALLLQKFVDYPDMLPLDAERVNKIYTPYPDRTMGPNEKKELIVFPRPHITSSKGGMLIIGVDVAEHHQESTAKLIEFIQSSPGLDRLYFKPHYADLEKVFQSQANAAQLKFIEINDSRCIEEIIGGLDIDTVICSHFSSALVNLKVIYQDKMEVIYYAHPGVITLLGKELVSIIGSLGIKIIMQE